ncbi:VOC family protein [Microbacterium lacus]|uniref:bleomycin resistance protein n=1 Tax=Microbacterium lacus TaxID=415217 RepID=UPI00384D8D1D
MVSSESAAVSWSGSASAILPVAELDRAVTFYRELGFDVQVAEVGGYAFVEASGIRFHLSESPGFDPFTDAGMIYLYVDDVDSVHAALSLPSADSLPHQYLVERRMRGESLARIGVLRDEEWGMREFYFTDPDNNLVRVGSRLPASD